MVRTRFAIVLRGPKRVNAPGIDFADLPRIDVVLLSHNHYDHLDLATLARLKAAHDPLVVTPLGNDAIIRAAVPDMRIETRDWGENVEVNGATIHIAPAHHWSARGARDRSMALWCGFVVEAAAGKVYFAGDTGFHAGRNYRAIAERHGSLRLAILPIGAYEPRWFMEAQHQNPEEAVEGHEALQCGFRCRLPLGNVPSHQRADRRAAPEAFWLRSMQAASRASGSGRCCPARSGTFPNDKSDLPRIFCASLAATAATFSIDFEIAR